MAKLTRSWDEIVEHYDDAPDVQSVLALRDLAKQIRDSRLSDGLHAWTSMWDLCIVQTEAEYPYNGSYLKIAPAGKKTLEFRYIDSTKLSKHWDRTVPSEAAWDQLLSFFDQLHWFTSLDEITRGPGNKISS